MARRILLWTLAGFLVACGWAVYAWASAPLLFGSRTWTLIEITCPVAALVGRSMPLSIFWSVILNAVTYAALGLIVEVLLRGFSQQMRPRHS